MHSARTNRGTSGLLSISDAGPRFGSRSLASSALRGALTLAMFSALLLTARQAQAQTEIVLYNFTGGSDGSEPQSNLTSDGKGNFYGTTDGGGVGTGTVFELSPNGSGGWNETVLHSFCSVPGCPDGELPVGNVIFDRAGNLYGTAEGGGNAPDAGGVVFELSPVGANWTETILHSFAGGADGAQPMAGLIMDPAGNLYGTTYGGGNGNAGTVFELSPNGGGWTEQVIYNVSIGVGGGLNMDTAGNIFGFTPSTVFELSPNGTGGWNPTVILTFPRSYQKGPPVLDQDGNLYGTSGGLVFKLIRGKNGKWKERGLYYFKGYKSGAPTTAIVFDASGNIYGTTASGGQYGNGTVFELVAPVGPGSYQGKVLWSFNNADGNLPWDSLILDSTGNLYGTTYRGGSSGYGVVFEVTGLPAATTTALTSSPNPSTHGQAVTFTAVVTSSAGAPPDGETVTFEHGTTVLGTGTLSGGSASFTTSTLPVGTIAVTALYFGDSNFSGNTSNTVNQVVAKLGK